MDINMQGEEQSKYMSEEAVRSRIRTWEIRILHKQGPINVQEACSVYLQMPFSKLKEQVGDAILCGNSDTIDVYQIIQSLNASKTLPAEQDSSARLPASISEEETRVNDVRVDDVRVDDVRVDDVKVDDVRVDEIKVGAGEEKETGEELANPFSPTECPTTECLIEEPLKKKEAVISDHSDGDGDGCIDGDGCAVYTEEPKMSSERNMGIDMDIDTIVVQCIKSEIEKYLAKKEHPGISSLLSKSLEWKDLLSELLSLADQVSEKDTEKIKESSKVEEKPKRCFYITCFICKRKGHSTKNCLYNKRSKREKREKSAKREKSIRHSSTSSLNSGTSSNNSFRFGL
ncbi:hypothetical protein NECID01_1630 [Nematocida sp. AWRm77]|nr:hypothetical protein NECID01_1630 [Nematocida sp. AWRm77]